MITAYDIELRPVLAQLGSDEETDDEPLELGEEEVADDEDDDGEDEAM